MAAIEQVGSGASVRRRPVLRGQITRLAGYLAMLAAVTLIGLPLIWLLSAAFKETAEIYVVPATWIPNEPTIRNFPRAWNAAPFGLYYLNTTFITVVSVLGKLLMGATTAYALVMLRFPGKSLVF